MARRVNTAEEKAVDVGMLMLSASYGWENIGDDLETTALTDRLNEHPVAECRRPGEVRIARAVNDQMRPDRLIAYAEVLMPYLRQSHTWLETYLDSLRPFLDAAAPC
jgi:hypothetical protein